MEETTKTNIPLRAEKMDYFQLRNLKKILPELGENIAKSLSSNNIIQVVGPKGVGKTIHLLAYFLDITEGNVDSDVDYLFPGGIYFDVETGKMDIFDPKIYCSEEYLTKNSWIIGASKKRL